MARLGVGRLLNGGKVGRRTMLASMGVGVTAALMEGNRSQDFMNESSRFLLGSDTVDNDIMGTDVSPGELFNPIDINIDPFGAGLGGAAVGKLAGMGWKGAIGVGVGAALATTVAHAVPPLKYINGSMMSDAFAEKDKQYTAALQDTYIEGAASLGSDYYNTQFPGPTKRRRRYTTGATGDMVLGMHNVRMG